MLQPESYIRDADKSGESELVNDILSIQWCNKIFSLEVKDQLCIIYVITNMAFAAQDTANFVSAGRISWYQWYC